MSTTDEMLALLRALTEAGELVAVDEIVHVDLPNDVEAFVLRFERGVLSIVVNADDDTLSLHEGVLALVEGQSQQPSIRGGAWAELLHRTLRWAWIMRNHQGYVDGVQLELAHAGEGKGSVVQLIAIASAIKVYEVRR